ncbi:chondroitinase-B domain-containing protein [Mariniflexile sp.]|uniref:chondroitinase-B domain-containing protein n=1 Tax=Mariniflexile sp. TaxID=1979402 RepID=UPI003568D1BD
MKNRILLILIMFVFVAQSQVVSNNTELQSAISNATAGTTIILANGIWNNTIISINKTGAAANPITIKAQNPGQVFLQGAPQISLGGNFIIFEGFVFKNPSNLVSVSGGSKTTIEPIIEFRDASNNECNNCKVTNIKIDSFNGTASQATDTFKWIIIYGQYNEISHSSFIGKNGVGSIINDNRDNAKANYTKIHHNYFAERTPVGDLNALNDQDAIRIGNSATSLSDSYTEVYNNFFYKWSGEIEVISNKSGKNKYYNNTFRDYSGALTLRHGNNCDVFDNYFLANNYPMSGGVRVMGEGHKVYNNYIEGIRSRKEDGSSSNGTGGINIANGKSDGVLNGYLPVIDAIIVNNTLVNCDYGIRVGTTFDSNTQNVAPNNVIIGNNIIFLDEVITNASSNRALQVVTQLTGDSKYENNIKQTGIWDSFGTVSATGNINVESGLLVSGADFYRLPSGSSAINYGAGTYNFLTEDVLGSSRPTTFFDAGAEEYGGNGTNFPYKEEDVNVKIGFLSSPSPYISLSTNALEFNKTENSSSFDISSNVDWNISEEASWISINPISGSNGSTVTVTVLENSTGVNRSATITVSQNGGGESSTLIVNQSNGVFIPSNAEKITGLTVTGVGTQTGGINIPENTLDSNTSTRWSGESYTGSAYLTYNLQCPKIISSVKIYFLNGDTRTSSFKIATSIDGVNFTDATGIVTSSLAAGFQNFPLISNPTVQYVRILGYGNSSPSGWNSYQEVEIYGENTCSILNNYDAVLKENKLILYPVPVKDGYLNLNSKTASIGSVKIFDVLGKVLFFQKIESTTAKLDVSHLTSGVYFLKTDTTISRFVVN